MGKFLLTRLVSLCYIPHITYGWRENPYLRGNTVRVGERQSQADRENGG